MMIGVMRSFWKVFVALALMLPLGAFVAGSLVSSAADDPSPRQTIIVDDSSGTPSQTPSTDPSPSSTPKPRAQQSPQGADDGTAVGDDDSAHGDDDGLDE